MTGATPASPVQQGIWFTERVGGAGTAYHMPLAIHLFGDLDVPALVRACEGLVARHPLLAAAFEERSGVPWVVPAATTPRVAYAATSGDAVGELVRTETLRPFDLGRGPLVRFTLCAPGPGRHLLLVVAHHLVFDGESKDVLVRDLGLLYGGAPDLPELPPDGEVAADGERRMAAALAPARELWARAWRPPEPPRLPGLTGDGSGPGESFEQALDEALDALGATRFEVLLAALLALLHRYGNEEAAVAVDLSTRTALTRDCIGPFVNELPITSRLPAEATFAELVAATRARLREVYAVREVPLARAMPGIAARVALAPVSMSYRRRSGDPLFPGVQASVEWMGFNHAARNTLHVQLLDEPPALALSLQHHPAASDRRAAGRVAAQLVTLLRGAVAAPSARVSDLPLLPAEERTRLLVEWNRTAAGHAPATLPRIFAARAAAAPDRVAVTGGGRRLTYAELDAGSRRVGHRLRALGVSPGALVAVCAERSPELLAGLLGVLRAGGAYLPLDPGHPAARLASIVADAGAGVVLTEDRLRDRFAGGQAAVLGLDEPGPADSGDLPALERPGDLAYVMYTSGSTGRPKGVEVEHRSLVNVLLAMRDALGSGPEDAWLALTSPSFDISTLELFLPLVTGGRVVIAPDAEARDGGALLRLVREHGVTHVQATPSGWRLLLDAGFDEPGVVALCGGEALPVPLARDLRARAGRLLNAYGPTETTVWSMLQELSPPVGAVTIGLPLANTRVHLLDERLDLVPTGLEGELCIAGDGVARGYRGRPGLTAERFVADPFGPPGSRLYRTGDRARRRPDGAIEFLGRTDQQVKLLGHRVELGEVEAALAGHAGVGRAAVALRHDEGAEPRLVAYVVAAAGGAAPGVAELRGHLAGTLPAHMVPGAFVTLERLPLTASGKLDRAALPEPPRHQPSAEPAPALDPALVADVGDICREVMKLDDIQPDESLFELGGHSLTMTMIAARIRKRLKLEVPLHVFYDEPTIAGIVQSLTGGPDA